jgi:hypothetical protein
MFVSDAARVHLRQGDHIDRRDRVEVGRRLRKPTTVDGKETVMTSPYPREPNIQSGGEQEPGGLVPPYEGRSTTGKSKEELSEERADTEGHFAGPRETSQAEREGLTDTDPNPSGPHGVGASTSSQGNTDMLGASEEARRAERTDAGIGGPKEPTTQGDQGG